MDNFDEISALRFEKYRADKKYIKHMSNALLIPLLLQLAFSSLIMLIAGIMVMLFRTEVLRQANSFNFSTLSDFLSQTSNSDWLNNIAYALAYFLAMFITFVLIAAALRQNPFRRIPFKVRHRELIFPSIVIGLALSLIGELYTSYFETLLGKLNLKVYLPQFSFPENVPALIVYFIDLSILAPICEELIFRGMIMHNLRKYGDFFALFVSSLLFGILHANFEQTPFAFIVGFGLGLAAIETGSVFASMLLHFCINTISLIFSGISYYAGDNIANYIYIGYIIVIVILTIITIIKLIKKNFFKGIKERYFLENMPVPLAFGIFAKTPAFIIYSSLYFLTMLLSLRTM